MRSCAFQENTDNVFPLRARRRPQQKFRRSGGSSIIFLTQRFSSKTASELRRIHAVKISVVAFVVTVKKITIGQNKSQEFISGVSLTSFGPGVPAFANAHSSASLRANTSFLSRTSGFHALT